MSALVSTPLYPALMGADWAEVDPAVQGAHLTSGERMEAVGLFEVEHGEGRLAPLIARVMRLPPEAAATPTHLSVTRDGRFERWSRRFGDGPEVVTLQARGPGGTMEERFGAVWLRFRLRVDSGGLRYEQTSSRLGLGPLSVPLPGFLAPAVTGFERPSGIEGRTQVEVEIMAPLVGRVVRYSGWIEVQGGG